MSDEQLVLICDCRSLEHIVIIDLLDETQWDKPCPHAELVFSPLLNTYYGFWGRLCTATKYVFGHKSSFGLFDSVSMQETDLPKLKALITSYEAALERAKQLSVAVQFTGGKSNASV